jgi:hypothetical protein
MISSVNSNKKWMVSFRVCTDDNAGKIWVEVEDSDYNYYNVTKFDANEYGRALKFYSDKQAEYEAKYPKAEQNHMPIEYVGGGEYEETAE